MSIWSSVDGDPRASNMDDPRADNTRGTGADELMIDVATATSWHGSVRFTVYSSEPGVRDVELLLSKKSAEALRSMLGVALERIRSTRANRGEPEEQRPSLLAQDQGRTDTWKARLCGVLVRLPTSSEAFRCNKVAGHSGPHRRVEEQRP